MTCGSQAAHPIHNNAGARLVRAYQHVHATDKLVKASGERWITGYEISMKQCEAAGTDQDDGSLLDVFQRKLGVRRQPRHCVGAAQSVHAAQRGDAPVAPSNCRATLGTSGAVHDVLHSSAGVGS